MRLPSGRDWLFSVRTFAGAMLALWIAFRLDLDRPYWAMATAYIVAQPLTGAMRSKALYRFCGTLLGAIAAVALVPNLTGAPVLLVLAMALWTGICLFFALLDRTPRSYVFMLAGYTAAIIGFPSVNAPGAIFSTALSRVEEITLGLVCTAVVGSIVFPRSIGPALTARILSWRDNACAWAQDALAGRPRRAERRRLAADVIEIDLLGSQIAFDASNFQHATRPLRALRQRMVLLVPVLSSITDRVAALEQSGSVTPALRGLLAGIGNWLRRGGEAGRWRDEIGALQPPVAAQADWNAIMLTSLLLRLRDLVDLWQDADALREQIAAGSPVLPPLAAVGSPQLVRHRDYGMALLSGFSAALTVGLVCLFWIAAAWPEGAVAAELAAVACCFFATQDDPVPAMLVFLWASLGAVAMDAVYLFAILPQAEDFTMLVLALAPAFVLFALLSAQARTASIGMALTANGATLLSLQSTYAADFASFVNSSVAFVLGLAAAAAVTRLVRSVGAEWSARRLLQASWGDIAAAARHAGDRGAFAGLMVDRLTLLVPRLALAEHGADLAALDTLADLRVGINVVDLQRDAALVPDAARRAIAAVQERIAVLFQSRAARRDQVAPGPELLGAVDAALGAVAAAAPNGHRRTVLLELVGIRRGLFPTAPPYVPAPAPPPVAQAA